MKNILQKITFISTILLSLSLAVSTSYAKDEPTEKPKTSKDKQTKTEKSEKKSEKKTSESKKSAKSEKSEKKSEKKSTKDNLQSDSKSKDEKAKTTKKADSKKSNDTATKPNAKSKTTASNTNQSKKQYKNTIVNINKADAKTFSHYLMGIGDKRAKAIVAYRSKQGKFKAVNDLLKIEGIGEKIFAGLKKNVSLTKGETTAPKKK
jgi:competence protein ComEA